MASHDDDLVVRLTSRSYCTRFSASQYVEFRKLIDSLPLYIKTFRAFKFKDVKEYQIAGKDFLLDLCSACDILKPFIELSVSLQGLSVHCCKACIWWERLRNHMKRIEEGFSFENIPSHFPLLKEFYETIVTAGVYKNTNLVTDGCLYVPTQRMLATRKQKLLKIGECVIHLMSKTMLKLSWLIFFHPSKHEWINVPNLSWTS